MRRENLNASERIEHEKICVARNDVGRAAAHSELEKLVVVRITARCYLRIDIDPLSASRQDCQKTSNICLIDVSAKLFPAQNPVKFGKRCKRKQDPPFAHS